MSTNLYSVYTQRPGGEPKLRGQVNVVEAKHQGETILDSVEGVRWNRFVDWYKHEYNARLIHPMPDERKILIILE